MDPNSHLDPELLSAYLDGEVSPDERVLAERHLAACETCQQELASLRRTVSLMQRLPLAPLPRTFYVTEGMVAPPKPATRDWRRWLTMVAPLSAAVALLLLVMVVVIPQPQTAMPTSDLARSSSNEEMVAVAVTQDPYSTEAPTGGEDAASTSDMSASELASGASSVPTQTAPAPEAAAPMPSAGTAEAGATVAGGESAEGAAEPSPPQVAPPMLTLTPEPEPTAAPLARDDTATLPMESGPVTEAAEGEPAPTGRAAKQGPSSPILPIAVALLLVLLLATGVAVARIRQGRSR